MSTKTELQQRIEKLETETAALKADLAKCDCADGIEQEKCWHAAYADGGCHWCAATKKDVERMGASGFLSFDYPAYMPECRAVIVEDMDAFISIYHSGYNLPDMVAKLHKLGFRIKVSP